MIRNRRAIRSLIAAAGFVTGFAATTPALAQSSSNDVGGSTANLSPAEQIDRAEALIGENKLVRAKSVLSALQSKNSGISLSDRERSRVLVMLANTNRRLKEMNPVEVSLQTADEALSHDDVRTALAHVEAVIAAPKATNEQVAEARGLRKNAEDRRTLLAPTVIDSLDAGCMALEEGDLAAAKTNLEAVQRSGVVLEPAQQARFEESQTRLVDAQRLVQTNLDPSRRVDAGMMQPGVVKRREPKPPSLPDSAPAQPEAVTPVAPAPASVETTAPAPVAQPAPVPVAQPEPAAPTPAPAPAPAQPTMTDPVAPPATVTPQPVDVPQDPVAQAMYFEAQSLLAEADQAFDQARYNEASRKYDRILREFADKLSDSQKSHVSARLAEARAQMGANSGNVLGDITAQNSVAKQAAEAEFKNDIEQSKAALASGDASRASDLAAAAGLRIKSARQFFSAPEIEAYDQEVKALKAEIATRADEIARASLTKAEEDRARDARLAASEQSATKTRKIVEAVERVRALQAEQKFEEALEVTDQILFLDPTSPTGRLLKIMLEDMIIYRQYYDIRRRKQVSYAQESIDNLEATIGTPEIMAYPTDWPKLSYNRGEPIAFAETEENRRVLATLEGKRIPVDFTDTPLSSVVAYLETVSQLEIDVDWPSLELVGVNKDAPITLNLSKVQLRAALDRVLEKASVDTTNGAAWTIADGVINIASREVINRNKALVVYTVRDLLFDIPNYDNAPEFDLQTVLRSGGGGGGAQSPFRQNNQEDPDSRTVEERTDELVDIITSNVDQNGWQDNGGDVGTMQRFQGNLIVTQTPANHRQIQGLLSKLREQRALQVNVETRFLLVSTNFFEQIGFDLDVYFNGDNNQVRAARAANPGGQIQPSDFFAQNGTLNRRVSPPPFDVDGDGAVDPQPSQAVALPSPLSVIGAGQNSLGLTELLTDSGFASRIIQEAPALGIAGQFLDDIQVDFMIKATQADTRTVNLTAPRLTFMNGQRANISVATQIAFVSDLNPVVSESAVGFDPDLEVVSEGVVLDVEGVVSSDRRYVTLNVQTAVSKVEGFANAPVTAVAGGQLVNSADTQSFIQLPTVTVTQVNTTAVVPDQGTILLGGQRLITEAEVETGVPVLSKIPIINRFFTNRTESREEQTLLILIKPTVLIQSEQEEKNFPGLLDSIEFGG